MLQGLQYLHLANGRDGKSVFFRFRINSLQCYNFTRYLVGTDEHAPIEKMRRRRGERGVSKRTVRDRIMHMRQKGGERAKGQRGIPPIQEVTTKFPPSIK